MSPPSEPRIYRVAELNRRIGLALDKWNEVWVEGELSDLSTATSGHRYFTLNDPLEAAQVRVVMYAGDAQRSRTRFADGERIRVRGRFKLYEPRGSLQLVAKLALPVGDGDKREQLEKLKRKLHKEGLFKPERKRPLPAIPRVVGLVTSKHGAAWRDVVRVLSARVPVRLIIADCRVQGADAAWTIVTAIQRLGRFPGVDVVIVARGGGASEDLGAFNEEPVARAIAECPVPVITGIGHEVDDTIADLVADVRAATPSNAAERCVPERAAVLERFLDAERRVQRALEGCVGRQHLWLERLHRRLSDPRPLLGRARHELLPARHRAEAAMHRRIVGLRQRLVALVGRLERRAPRADLARQRNRFALLEGRLADAMPRRIDGLSAERRAIDARLRVAIERAIADARSTLAERLARLDGLSPLKVLGRGYAIALLDGRALLRAGDASVGDALEVRLAEGRLEARVVAIDEERT
ncbi:MAG: exodeoxyribonuclease VII large subunit [Sandaracinaceae bacterium]